MPAAGGGVDGYAHRDGDRPSGTLGGGETPLDTTGIHTTMSITITEKAADKVREFLSAEDDAELTALRVAVQGGGCSGFQYALGFDTGPQDGDAIIEAHGVTVVVDPFSMPYLDGADIDFVDGLNGTGFSITNPNTVSGCGCGTSFQLKEGEEEGEGTTASAGGCSTCASA
jgi:iron-sulfur cluster assembly protein